MNDAEYRATIIAGMQPRAALPGVDRTQLLAEMKRRGVQVVRTAAPVQAQATASATRPATPSQPPAPTPSAASPTPPTTTTMTAADRWSSDAALRDEFAGNREAWFLYERNRQAGRTRAWGQVSRPGSVAE